MDYFEAYKPIRNKLRLYKPSSVVDCALNVLWRPQADKLKMLEQAPWQTMLLVKWALIDQQTSDRAGEVLSEKKFDLLRQELWELPSVVRRTDGQPVELFMRQLTYPQIEFQRSQSPIFARQPAILGALDKDHPLRKMFFEATGLDVLDFLDLSFATYTAFLEGNRYLTPGWFEDLRGQYGVAVDAFIRAISKNYAELVEYLRSRPDAKKRWASEYFEFTPIKRYPLFRQGDRFQAWHPIIFSRGIETFVHDTLCEYNGKGYMDQYSMVFEGHVIDLIRESGKPFLDESEIRRIIGRNESVTEALIPLSGGNLLIESKAGIFDDEIMSIGDATFIAKRLQPLVRAIGQARSVASKIYSSDKCPRSVRSNNRNFLIVVTNRLLNISRGRRLQTICGPEHFERSTPDLEQHLPLEHVYFVGIDEFERFTVACSNPAFDPIRFLDECVARDSNPVTTKFYFGNHLAHIKGVDSHARYTAAAVDAALLRLAAALEHKTS